MKSGEVGKIRPVVVLTNQTILAANPHVIFICPLSSQSHKKFSGLHVELEPRMKLHVKSYALIEHSRSMATSRLASEAIAKLTDDEVGQIAEKLGILVS